ncbi:MAG: VWA domain-containing protein [Thermogutta sp.]|nr:VWA domain-containing protein [Thermogutta sp.]
MCAFLSGLTLFPFLMVIVIGGLQIRMLRSRLQSAADAFATAEAARLSRHAALERVCEGRPPATDRVTTVAARKESVQAIPGIWDFATRRFHETGGAGNAVRVVVCGDSRSLGRLGRITAAMIGANRELKVQAVAAAVPRDIVFLVDLSGAMNDDTEPAWVPGGVSSSPPREQPMHAVRQALIAALHVILERNAALADAELRDRVAVIGYDAPQAGGAVVLQDLTADYGSAIRACMQLQAGSGRPPRQDVAAGLREGLRAAEKIIFRAQKRFFSPPRDGWLVLIRYDGDDDPAIVEADRRTADGRSSRKAALPGGFGTSSRPGRGETAELIRRLRLEGLTLHAFTVGPANSIMERNVAAKDRGAVLPGMPLRQTPPDPADVEARLSEFLFDLAYSPRVRLVE